METAKLTEKNYLAWKDQILPLIEVKEPKQLIIMDGTEETNPAYVSWRRDDQLLRSLISGTLTEEVHTFIIGLKTTRELRACLAETFAEASHERELGLICQLQTLRKGNQCVTEYLKSIKIICDELYAMQKLVSDRDKVFWTVIGLGPKFDSFADAIMACAPPPTFSQLSASLLALEQRNAMNNTVQNTTSKSHAYICKKPGHDALRCWHRFNHSYQAEEIPQALAAMSITDPHDPEWIPDTGVTSHMTNNPGILLSVSPYSGSDKIIVRNGNELSISHIDSVFENESGDFDVASIAAPHASAIVPSSNAPTERGVHSSQSPVSLDQVAQGYANHAVDPPTASTVDPVPSTDTITEHDHAAPTLLDSPATARPAEPPVPISSTVALSGSLNGGHLIVDLGPLMPLPSISPTSSNVPQGWVPYTPTPIDPGHHLGVNTHPMKTRGKAQAAALLLASSSTTTPTEPTTSLGGRKIHVSGLVRLGSFGDEMGPFHLPPLMDSSPHSGKTNHAAAETAHMTCFSNPMEVQNNLEEMIDYFNTPLFSASSNPSNISLDSILLPKISLPNSFYTTQGAPNLSNFTYPCSCLMQEEAILRALLDSHESSMKQSCKTSISQETELSTDMNTEIYSILLNHEMGRKCFEDQEEPSTSAGPTDIDSAKRDGEASLTPKSSCDNFKLESESSVLLQEMYKDLVKRKVELEEHLVEISKSLTGMQEEMQRLTWAMDKENGKLAIVGGAENDKGKEEAAMNCIQYSQNQQNYVS
ncbi:hypothetical protein HHK36_010096 [Tetracentron sinense]|uniref:Uncharacterized protein n=1 Tax=Tetracentron sinense TaxID=13715 RepID=A0A835DIY6_TETSI|nr:hypothetical protein HHK36_010096 [Tetracentron sinense]